MHAGEFRSVNAFVALYLAQDGLASGAIYALLALAIVAVFSVTRVIFVPIGEFVSIGALTYVGLQESRGAPAGKFLATLVLAHLAADLFVAVRKGALGVAFKRALRVLLLPALLAAAAIHLPTGRFPPVANAVFAVALMTAAGPLVYRLAYQPSRRPC